MQRANIHRCIFLCATLLPAIASAQSASVRLNSETAIATAEPSDACPAAMQGIKITLDEATSKVDSSADFGHQVRPAVRVRRGSKVETEDTNVRSTWIRHSSDAEKAQNTGKHIHASAGMILFGCLRDRQFRVTGGKLKLDGRLLNYNLELDEGFQDLSKKLGTYVSISYETLIFEAGSVPSRWNISKLSPAYRAESREGLAPLGAVDIKILNVPWQFASPHAGWQALAADLSFSAKILVLDGRDVQIVPSN